MFLSQVAFACDYIHRKHIVHGALRAEYVNVVSPNQVGWPLLYTSLRQILIEQNDIKECVLFLVKMLTEL